MIRWRQLRSVRYLSFQSIHPRLLFEIFLSVSPSSRAHGVVLKGLPHTYASFVMLTRLAVIKA